jgi:hypothetical protein
MHNVSTLAMGFRRTTHMMHFCIVSFSILTSLIFFASCSKELKAPEPLPFETGVLSVSKNEVVINSTLPSDEAVTFSWTAEKNSLIYYNLILTAGGKSDTVIIAQNTVGKRFTNGQLNLLLIDKLGLAVGVSVDLTAELKASIPINGKTASSNAVTIKVTPAPKGAIYDRLWIVGDATPSGWDVDNPREMTIDPDNSFQFKYNESLTAGEFKIPTTLHNWSTDWFMPPTNNPPLTSTAVTIIQGGSPDNKWRITTPGLYKILLNISSTPFINITPFTPYPNIYIVGDATTGGWDISNSRVMTPDPSYPYIFTWTGPLKSSGEGAFKFPLDFGNWGGDFIMAPAESSRLTTTTFTFVKGGTSYPDNKFVVKPGEDGTYKITINQLKETISIQKQ